MGGIAQLPRDRPSVESRRSVAATKRRFGKIGSTSSGVLLFEASQVADKAP
jgi:hypothetical protein